MTYLVLWLALLLLGSASAQSNGPEVPPGFHGILIAPPRYELKLPVGARKRQQFSILAKGYRRKVTTRVQVMDWAEDIEGRLVPLPSEENPYSAASWIKVSLNPLHLNPDEPVIVPFEVHVPPGPFAGSYWAAITFSTEPAPAKANKGVTVLNRLRIWGIVYVTIAGTEEPGAEISNFGFGPEKKNLILDVQNTGNVYLRLHGTLTYKDKSGKTIKAEKLPERVLLRDLLVRYRIPVKAVPKEAVVASVEVTAKGLTSPLYAEVALK